MIHRLLSKAIGSIRENDLQEVRRRILSSSSGVLHLGAHVGQEAGAYSNQGLPVVWVEGDPKVYERLQEKIAPYANQRAINALLGRENVDLVDFHIASNDGQSSSVYPLANNHGFESIGLQMVESIRLPLVRLDEIIPPDQITAYSHWVVDLQGAELEALIGAGDLIDSCYTMDVEVSTREVYSGGARYHELADFLSEKGFCSLSDPGPGRHLDHLFVRARSAPNKIKTSAGSP